MKHKDGNTVQDQVAVQDQAALSMSAQLSGFADFKSKDKVVGLEVLDQTDLKIPKIKLLQSNSEEVADGLGRPGQFYNSVTKKACDTIDCILLALGKSRVKWKSEFKRGEQAECKSFDAVKGDKGACAKCEFASWGVNNEKPKCGFSYSWLGMLPDGTFFRLLAHGLSVSPTKDFLNIIAPNKLPAFIYKMTLGSVTQKNEFGTFQVMTYNFQMEDDAKIKTIDPSKFKEYEDLAISMKDLFLSSQEQDLADIIVEDQGAENGIF